MCRIPNLVMKHSNTTMSDCEFIKKEYQAGECMIVELLYPKGALSLTEMLTMLKGQSQQQYQHVLNIPLKNCVCVSYLTQMKSTQKT